jgi:hypothetical protein
MFFRLEIITGNLGLSVDEKVQISFKSPPQVTILLRRRRADELTPKDKPEDGLCLVTIEKDPPRKLREYFANAPPSPAPSHLKNFSDELEGELANYGKRLLCLFRWRSGSSSPHNPIRYVSKLKWSQDDEHWNSLSYSISLFPIFGFPEPQEKAPLGEAVANLMEQGVDEPLGHELFREAWDLQASNPRSALIIGIAAAEIGFKQCVGILVPDAKWLVDNVPSPPLEKMLHEYLPQLPTRRRLNGRVVPPPGRWLGLIKTGVKIRNDIVHGEKYSLTLKTLREVLGVIRELLYLLDIYCGHEWAWDRLGVQPQRELLEMAPRAPTARQEC